MSFEVIATTLLRPSFLASISILAAAISIFTAYTAARRESSSKNSIERLVSKILERCINQNTKKSKNINTQKIKLILAEELPNLKSDKIDKKVLDAYANAVSQLILLNDKIDTKNSQQKSTELVSSLTELLVKQGTGKKES